MSRIRTFEFRIRTTGAYRTVPYLTIIDSVGDPDQKSYKFNLDRGKIEGGDLWDFYGVRYAQFRAPHSRQTNLIYFLDTNPN